MSIVKIVLVFMVGIEAGAEQIRPVEYSYNEQLTERIRPVEVRQQGTRCRCKCEQHPGEMAKLAAELGDILSAVQERPQKKKRNDAELRPLM